MSSPNLEVNAVNRANEASETSRAKAVSEMSEVSDLTAELSAKHVTKLRLDEINKIKDYLNSEIKERKDIVKKISQYIFAFDYADKPFITLSASFGTLSIVSHATVVGIPVGIAGASLTVKFLTYKETMLSYSLKCKKNTESIDPKVPKTRNGKTMVLSICAICGSKKSKFIKEQQAKGLLSNLGIRTPLNKIPLLGDILF